VPADNYSLVHKKVRSKDGVVDCLGTHVLCGTRLINCQGSLRNHQSWIQTNSCMIR
jgi:hypothetical protein